MNSPDSIMKKPIIVLLIVLLLMVFITFLTSPSKLFEEACLKRGGSFGELQNVTCALGKPYCSLYCNINGTTINYYDKSELNVEVIK